MTTPSEEKESAELRHSCIGELEHDLHTAFAAKRVPSEDFVHVQVIDQQREDGAPHHGTMLPLEPHRRRPPPPLPPPTTTTTTTTTTTMTTTTTTLQDEAVTATLNEFCSEATFQEPREPLVLFGPTGCGKSSALANWLSQRRHVALRRSRTANSARSVVAPGLVSLAAVAANAAAAAAVVATPHHTSPPNTAPRATFSHDEFIFWHVVGCSRQSTFVGHMLRRLMTELRHHFELSREVSESEEKLSWDFPRYERTSTPTLAAAAATNKTTTAATTTTARMALASENPMATAHQPTPLPPLPRFLELAVRKGRVLMVIDGAHRLRTEDGDAKLNWLPLKFPPNVRLILSATDSTTGPDPILSPAPRPSAGIKPAIFREGAKTSLEMDGEGGHVVTRHMSVPQNEVTASMLAAGEDEDEDGPKKNRILMELERRKWQMVNMSGFTYPRVSNSIVKEFVSLTAQAESASAVAGAGGGTFLTSIGEDGADMMSQVRTKPPRAAISPRLT